MKGATKTRSRRREWLEPVALEADVEDLVVVRVHERGEQEPVGPVDRDPALDALVGGDGSGAGDEPRRGDGRSRERGPRLAVGGLDREAIEVYVDAPSNAFVRRTRKK